MRLPSDRGEWRRPSTGTPEFYAVANAARASGLWLRVALSEDEAAHFGGDYRLATRGERPSVLFESDRLEDIAHWLRVPQGVSA